MWRVFDIGRYDMGDPRVFGREDWGVARGKFYSLRGKMYRVETRVENEVLPGPWARQSRQLGLSF